MERAPKNAEVETHLGKLRQARGVSAAQLAAIVDVSRQTIYAMEAGSYVPNTALALKLARALEVSVENLFRLLDPDAGGTLRTQSVTLLPGAPPPHPGQSVQLCRVDHRTIASAPSPVPWYLPPSDGVVINQLHPRRAKTDKLKVQVFQPGEEFEQRVLIAGCDPGISVLARHAQSAGVELVLAHRNSSQSLALLKQGCIHIAGTHLRDEASGESNLPEVNRTFPKHSVAVISFAVWEEGVVLARGNPKGIRGVEDFARADVSIANRAKGAGSRLLLDSRLALLKIPVKSIRGYQTIADGHLSAAWQVHSGAADACLATNAAARAFGLDFLPLVRERYDLVMRRSHLDLPGIQTLLDVLGRSRFRRALETLGGYEAEVAGQRML